MDRIVVIQAATSTIDAYGVETVTWANFVTLRAKKIEGVAHDTEHGATAISDTKVTLQSYFVDGITLEHRAVYECGDYQIKSLSEIGRRKGLEIVIEKLGP
jgi:hypothetical protein